MNSIKSISHTYQSLDSSDMKVLIVDDDEYMRHILYTATTQWGYQVIETSNAEEAWQFMQQPQPPMLILLDWHMPGISGLDLCEMIRKNLNFYPYIIFVTEVSGTENILKGLNAGADEFLLKPVNFSDLRVRLFAGERIIKYINIIEEQRAQIERLDLIIKNKEK